jgi:hypothetical protein
VEGWPLPTHLVLQALTAGHSLAQSLVSGVPTHPLLPGWGRSALTAVGCSRSGSPDLRSVKREGQCATQGGVMARTGYGRPLTGSSRTGVLDQCQGVVSAVLYLCHQLCSEGSPISFCWMYGVIIIYSTAGTSSKCASEGRQCMTQC